MLIGASPTPKPIVTPDVDVARSSEVGGAESVCSEAPRTLHGVRDVVFVGVGSSTAYLLNGMNRQYAPDGHQPWTPGDHAEPGPYAGSVAIVGQQDAWAPAVRGRGVLNHQEEIVGQWGSGVPGHAPAYMGRDAFVEQNREQIGRARELGADVHEQALRSVERLDNGNFQVTLADGGKLETRQLILGMGAGPHSSVPNVQVARAALNELLARLPQDKGARLDAQQRSDLLGTDAGKRKAALDALELDGAARGELADAIGRIPMTRAERMLLNISYDHRDAVVAPRVMDLDSFMRLSENTDLAGKRVVVHGPNAGIDAVERAREKGARVDWLVRTTDPVLLDRNLLVHANEITPATEATADSMLVLRHVGDVAIARGEGDRPLHLTGTGLKGDPAPDLQADYYVYALGQDAEAPGAVLPCLGALARDLEPVYDNDQVFGDAAYKTVLGLQSKGSDSSKGLVIVGAAVAQIAPSVSHNYLERAARNALEASTFLAYPGYENGAALRRLITEGASKEAIMTAYETCRMEVGAFDAEVSVAGLTRPLDSLKSALGHLFEAREYFAARDPGKRGVALELENQTSTGVASVVVSPQLGTVKAASAALAGIMPAYVSHGQANFTSDDRTMLRAYLAETRDGLGDADAERFVQEVISTRHLKRADFVDKAADALCGAAGAQAFVQDGLSPGLRDAVRAYHAGNEEDGAPALRMAVVRELNQDIDEGRVDTPVRGVPDSVRRAYEARLDRLASGAQPSTPMVLDWVLRTPVAAVPLTGFA